jgi:hypothetical protein
MFMSNHLVGFGVVGSGKVVTYSDADADEVDRTTYTFAGKNIGIPSPDRRVHVITWAGNGGVSLSSLTVGGITATVNLGATNTSEFGQMAIATASVPSGTTADIAVTWSAGQIRCAIIVWWSTGLTANTCLATGSTATDAGTITLAESVPGGFAIAGAFSNGGSPTLSWGGSPSPTEDVDYLPAALGSSVVSGAHVATIGPNQTFVPDFSNFLFAGAVAAAF